MCKAMEDRINENSIQIAIKLLKRGKETYEEIAEDSGIALEKIRELANQINPT